MTETLFGGGPCALCGRNPSAGFAKVGDEWYCHGDFDPEPTCYMRAQRKEAPAWAVVFGVQSREERMRILDEYAEHAIEAESAGFDDGRWGSVGREY